MSRSIVLSGTIGIVLAVLAAARIVGGTGPSTSEAGGAGCTQSFAAWQGLAGRWEGTWVNHTFSSNGALTAEVTINNDCTAKAVIDGIFMQSGPQTVDATYRDENGTTIEVQNDPIFGDTTVNIAAGGTLTLNGSDMHQSIESVTGQGNVSFTEINLDIHMVFTGGGTADETIHLTRELPIPTPTPTSTPTPTPTRLWGDWNCDGEVDLVDALAGLRFVAALGLLPQVPPCFTFGMPVVFPAGNGLPEGPVFGDSDCSGEVDLVDSLAILRHVAALPVPPPPIAPGCPAIGQLFGAG